MIDAGRFLDAAVEHRFRCWSGVPCSSLKPLINAAIDSGRIRYVGAANEGQAVTVAAGASLAGGRGAVLLQSTGLGNAVNPLTSLCAVARLPVLLICSWRGEPGGAPDEPQHALMGAITPRLLELMEIPWAPFPEAEADVEPALARAARRMDDSGQPVALVLRGGAVAPRDLRPPPPAARPPPAPALPAAAWPEERPSLGEVLDAVRRRAEGAALIATTGYTGRTLYALGDSERQLYVVGAMGCASSVALGLALARPERQVIVLDGDGAALMHLGALATMGYHRPRNLTHVLLDNERHESTGGQRTVTEIADLAAVAQACGYPRVRRAATAAAVAEEVGAAAGALTFIHVKLRGGHEADLPRPKVTPAEVASRFRAWFTGGAR